jgi:alpha-tubulin suppressor-like RCC1 family protein
VGGYSTAPIELFAGTPVRQASINFGVICVVTASDAVECVGPKESFAVAGSRMLGEDGYPERYRSVSVGAANVCAVSVANLAYCWGENRTGRVRPDTAVENPERPVFMAEDVASITAGITYTCAALGNGDVRCWGRNLFGDPLDTLSSRVGRVRAIAVGTQATWVLGEDGSVWSWGPAHPVTGGTDLGPINPGFRAETVAAGFGHACALGRDGAAWCWGSNLYGQLGTGVRSSSIVPVRVFPRNR